MKRLYFFTKSEKIGILALLLLVCTSFGINMVYEGEKAPKDDGKFEREVNEFIMRLSQEQENRKSPQITQEQIKNQTHKQSAPERKKEVVKIELNTADSTQLKQLRGIGSVFSKRIVRFRDYLGGYYSIEQLKEVYGMTDELYNSIRPNLKIDKNKIRKFSVNADSFSYKFRHPYLKKDDVKKIMSKKRENAGAPISAAELKELLSMPDNEWRKLSSYIE